MPPHQGLGLGRPRAGLPSRPSPVPCPAQTLDDLDCVKTAIKVEAQARESGEENMAHTMDVLVQQLHDGLRIVSK